MNMLQTKILQTCIFCVAHTFAKEQSQNNLHNTGTVLQYFDNQWITFLSKNVQFNTIEFSLFV